MTGDGEKETVWELMQLKIQSIFDFLKFFYQQQQQQQSRRIDGFY